jgi:hypothetical protein
VGERHDLRQHFIRRDAGGSELLEHGAGVVGECYGLLERIVRHPLDHRQRDHGRERGERRLGSRAGRDPERCSPGTVASSEVSDE